MHNSSIRIALYHYEHSEQEGKEPTLQVNVGLKTMFKSKGFKWKTVTNDVRTGSRIEFMEV